MLDGYWQNRPSEPVVRRIRETWAEVLLPYSLDEVRDACRQWVTDNPSRKPNYGHILAILRDNRAGAAAPWLDTMSRVTAAVSETTGIPEWMLRGKGRRTPEVCKARAEAMARCRDAGVSLAIIGEFFGGRDHTTVISALRNHGHERANA